MQLTYSAKLPVIFSNENQENERTVMDLLPEHASTFWKAGRLKTFEHWPFQSGDDSCNPERMAAAGFLAVGGKNEPDLAVCFLCGKQLDGWDPDDDPWQEHMKHQADCPFVKLNKQDESSWTIQDLFKLFKIFVVKECALELEKAVGQAKDQSARLASEIPQIYKGLRTSTKDLH